MGGGIMSGLMWGTMTSVIVLGVVSQMAPLPPSALQDVAVVTPREADPAANGANPQSLAQVPGDAASGAQTTTEVATAITDETLPLPDSVSGIGPKRTASGKPSQSAPFAISEPGSEPTDAERGVETASSDALDSDTSDNAPFVMAEPGDDAPEVPALADASTPLDDGTGAVGSATQTLADAEGGAAETTSGTEAAEFDLAEGGDVAPAEDASNLDLAGLEATPADIANIDVRAQVTTPDAATDATISDPLTKVAQGGTTDNVAPSPAQVATAETGTEVATVGAQAEVATGGAQAEVATGGAQAEVATGGAQAEVATGGAQAEVATVGAQAEVASGGTPANAATSELPVEIASARTPAEVATTGGGAEVASHEMQSELVAQARTEEAAAVTADATLRGASGTTAAPTETAERTLAALADMPAPQTPQAEDVGGPSVERVAAAQSGSVAGTTAQADTMSDAGSQTLATLRAELVQGAVQAAMAGGGAQADLVAAPLEALPIGSGETVARSAPTPTETVTEDTPAVSPARVAQIDRPLVTISEKAPTLSVTRSNTARLDGGQIVSHAELAQAAVLSSTGGGAPSPSQPVAEALASGELSRALGLAARTAITPDRPEVTALTQAKADVEVPEAMELPSPEASATANSDAVTEAEAVLAGTLPETATTESATTETAADEAEAATEEAPVRVAQATLPQVRRNTGGGLNVRVRPLTERSDSGDRPGRIVVGGNSALNRPSEATTPEPSQPAAETASAAANPDAATALERHAVMFENADSLPKFSIVLIDAGETGVDRQALLDLQVPVTFAVDPSRPDAAEVARGYRDAGFEVVLLAAGLPSEAQAQDVEVAFGTWTADVPEAVAVIDTQDGALAGNRVVAEQMAQVLAGDGHGLVLYDKGLNSAASAAEGAGVRTGLAFRQLDSRQERSPVIGRYLDRAAFKASQEGAVIVVGHTYSDTVGALVKWALEGRGKTMALAPISAVLRED